MENSGKLEEKYVDIEDLITESLSDKNITEDKEDMVLEYLCQAISETDSQGDMKKKAEKGDSYAYLQLASWHIANAKNIKDYCEAHKYASKAAKCGYVEAYYILGQLNLYGVGCSKNVHRAVRYLSYFTKQIEEKKLLNSDVMLDAYFKLAETEKALGHYKKAYCYYQKLQEYEAHYDAYMKEMQKEMKKRRNSVLFNLIFIACGFMVFSGLIYFFVKFFNEEAAAFSSRYKDKVAVTIVEEENVSSEQQTTQVEVAQEIVIEEEPIKYRVVTEAEFLALDFVEIPIVEATSTSEYISTKGNNFSAANLIDHDTNTTWQEGEEDAGIQQKLNFVLAEPTVISALRLENGKRMDKESFYGNNRLASFSIFTEDAILIELTDSEEVQYIIFENPIMESDIEITLESVFSGTQWNDTCITEIAFYE